MTLPAISIIIPTWNRCELLQQTLDSIQRQTFQDWEALVIDDGSNDSTEEKVQEISQLDSRIKYLKRICTNAGACACRNEGTELSQGKYIIYLDSDDCLAPWLLENRWREMEKNSDLDFAIFPGVLFRHQPGDMKLLWNADTEENDLDRFLKLEAPWQTTSPIWRRSSLVKLAWNEELPSLQDWDFHLRAVILNLKYDRFSPPDFFWRIPREESISRKSKSVEHPKAYERLFSQIQQLLDDAGLLTNYRRILLGGMYFWLAEIWLDRGEKLEALRVWKACYDRNLIESSHYFQGGWYLKTISNLPRFIRRLVRKYLEFTWPKGLAFKWSKTFRQTPLPPEYQLDISSLLTVR